MYENSAAAERAILVGVDSGEFDIDISLDELSRLAESAGADVLASVSQKRPDRDPATFIGAGKLEEIKGYAEALNADTLIFNDELSAAQVRNITDLTELNVIDRTTLILDIFASRADSREGKCQVELAQLKYMLPRLMGQGQALSRLGGGIGTRGPGETKLESDRRHIRRRILSLERELEALSGRRDFIRSRRKKNGVVTAALVGYTNVGKSSLFNALTGEAIHTADRLFDTLDPTSRAIELPNGQKVLLIDTVGFVRRLPHHLVEAFKSTLEDAATADVILNVCDISSPEMFEQIGVANRIIEDIGAGNTPMVTVCNKCDLAENLEVIGLKNRVIVSAKTGRGLDALLREIEAALPGGPRKITVLLPYSHAHLSGLLREKGKVISEEFLPEGIRVEGYCPAEILGQFREFMVMD